MQPIHWPCGEGFDVWYLLFYVDLMNAGCPDNEQWQTANAPATLSGAARRAAGMASCSAFACRRITSWQRATEIPMTCGAPCSCPCSITNSKSQGKFGVFCFAIRVASHAVPCAAYYLIPAPETACETRATIPVLNGHHHRAGVSGFAQQDSVVYPGMPWEACFATASHALMVQQMLCPSSELVIASLASASSVACRRAAASIRGRQAATTWRWRWRA